MKSALFLVQIILAVSLILVIIIQQKGAGLGSSFGGGEMSFYRTRRGAEKLLYWFTWILATAFIATSILGLLI